MPARARTRRSSGSPAAAASRRGRARRGASAERGTAGLGLAADRLALDRILGNLVDNALAVVAPGRHDPARRPGRSTADRAASTGRRSRSPSPTMVRASRRAARPGLRALLPRRPGPIRPGQRPGPVDRARAGAGARRQRGRREPGPRGARVIVDPAGQPGLTARRASRGNSARVNSSGPTRSPLTARSSASEQRHDAQPTAGCRGSPRQRPRRPTRPATSSGGSRRGPGRRRSRAGPP